MCCCDPDDGVNNREFDELSKQVEQLRLMVKVFAIAKNETIRQIAAFARNIIAFDGCFLTIENNHGIRIEIDAYGEKDQVLVRYQGKWSESVIFDGFDEFHSSYGYFLE